MSQADFLPVSGAQAGIWYGQQSSAVQGGYSTAQCLEFTGAIDADRLALAASMAVSEAEGLFEGFVATDSGPARVAGGDAERAAVPEIIDLRDNHQARELAWHQMAARREVPFALEQGPLYRQAFWRLADDHVLWWLNMHHVAADAWAYGLIQQRAAEHYIALGKGEDARAGWYGNIDRVIEEEQRYLASQALEQDRNHWHGLFSDDPEPVSPSGRFAPAQPHALRCEITLDRQHSQQFHAQCKAQQQGLAEAILAASAAWYARMCQRSDVTLGVPMMGRMQGAALRTPMTQVNMLPLRLRDDFSATPTQWCRSAAESLGSLRRHQRYRHEWLLRDLGRRPGRRPLLGMHVNVLPFDSSGQWPNSRVHKHHLVAGPVDDLVFSVYLGGDSEAMRLALDGNPALYSETELEWHLSRLAQWLVTFTASPDTPVSELMLATSEDRQALSRFNATDHPVEETHMATLFERQVDKTPAATALVAEGEVLDYLTLGREVQALADTLIEQGVCPGDNVGVALPRSLGMQVALLAIHHVGAAWLPLPLEYPDARLDDIVTRAAPRLILSDKTQRERFTRVPVLDLSLRHAASGRALISGSAAQRDPGLGAYILFTSGSTGKPKGVLVEHHAIVNRIVWMQARYTLGEGDRVLQKTPNGFDVSVWEFLWPMISGATLVMAREGGHRDPRYLIDTIINDAITTLHFVPSMLDILLDELSDRDIERLHALRQVFVSGEALSRDLEQRFLSLLPWVALHNLYGPTEAAVDVSVWQCDAGDTGSSVPIGAPIWNTHLHVLDAGFQPVPVGMPGELYIAGRNLARGYLGQPELTAERFIDCPALEADSRLYRTGDLARWRFDGALEYLGRIDHQVKLRGQRLELGEIEAVMLSHDEVAQAVVSVHGSGSNARLVGYVVPRNAHAMAVDTLKRHLTRTLPDYMVPAVIMVLDELPLSTNGKLDRRALPTPEAGEEGMAPATPRQQIMADLFAEMLDLERVGIRDNFFDLGGNSLNALQLMRRLNEALGTNFTIAALFEAPTIEALDALDVQGAAAGGLDVVLPLREAGEASPIFCVHPAGGLAWCYAGLARTLPSRYSLYGLQARGLLPESRLPETMEEMARDYIAQMRRLQPHGPYHLLGWSVGGMIAHTMASLLENEGEEVGMLALLDAYPADLWRDMTPPDEGMALEALLRIAGLADMALAEEGGSRRAQVIALLKREGSALGQLSSSTLDALVDVVINNSRLVRETRHPVYSGDMHFFTAATPRTENWLDRRAWQPYVGGRILNLDLPATHPELMHQKHLATIAQRLMSVLESQPVCFDTAP
ncbi:non-ribosomal peptide synthetase [Kushneria indalinina]|uniref:Enterobactin synthetase component F n=1 Tax=Kushneria indalinina DSM 14324 TaxID=1122140 RepID=A0A3D9DY92_9GAMM|nr:non-ribosomal peptide synthetase [Kushneria indalinina]REC95671.1 enterobactin synthetase component F [Kushneria indalinina DSM 14324]